MGNILNIYQCDICGKYFLVQGENNTRCCVIHSPGSCCHYNEKELTIAQINRIENIVEVEE